MRGDEACLVGREAICKYKCTILSFANKTTDRVATLRSVRNVHFLRWVYDDRDSIGEQSSIHPIIQSSNHPNLTVTRVLSKSVKKTELSQ